VRPLLEYCSTVWSLSSKSLVDQLESVLRRFTNRLPGLQSVANDELCERLKTDYLELRCLYADLILCYKIIHGLTVLPSDTFFTITSSHVTRGHTYKLFLPELRVNCRQYFFAVRIVKIWNFLPADVVSAHSISVFVKKIKCTDFSQFLIRKV